MKHCKNLNYGLPRVSKEQAADYLTAMMVSKRLKISLTRLYALRNNGMMKAAALYGNRLLYTETEVNRITTLLEESNNTTKMERDIANLMAKSARKNQGVRT
jgi:predicted site-specific integrase-resolvase